MWEDYREMIAVAVICARQAQITRNRSMAAELRRMAWNYQNRAAALAPCELSGAEKSENCRASNRGGDARRQHKLRSPASAVD